jgi:hypothetical protein
MYRLRRRTTGYTKAKRFGKVGIQEHIGLNSPSSHLLLQASSLVFAPLNTKDLFNVGDLKRDMTVDLLPLGIDVPSNSRL